MVVPCAPSVYETGNRMKTLHYFVVGKMFEQGIIWIFRIINFCIFSISTLAVMFQDQESFPYRGAEDRCQSTEGTGTEPEGKVNVDLYCIK